MPSFRFSKHRARAVLLLLCIANIVAPGQQAQKPPPQKLPQGPVPEKLTYRIEWRLVTAGTANLEFQRAANNGWTIDLNLESAGLVTRLYRVLDKYKAVSNDQFCASSVDLDAQEGKRHMLTHVTFDNARHKVDYTERNLIKNTTKQKELDIPACTHEIAGALATLSQIDLQPGKSTTLPVTDGKKLVYAKVEAQAKETISVDGKTYPAIRYEAFLFDNVLYKRKGRLLIWTTDDQERTPIQFQIQLGFPIGTISLELEKQQRL
jgi:hypothetical protein